MLPCCTPLLYYLAGLLSLPLSLMRRGSAYTMLFCFNVT